MAWRTIVYRHNDWQKANCRHGDHIVLIDNGTAILPDEMQ